METRQAKRVLLVDDDPAFVHAALAVLGDDVETVVASGVAAALDATERLQPDLIVLDVLLRGADAIWLLDALRQRLCGTSTPIICLARGPGALSLAQATGDESFHVHRREAGPEALRAAVLDGLNLTLARR